MKKILALLPLVAVLGLAGCEDKNEEEADGGDQLEYSTEQVKAKVQELGDTQGYEISYEVKASDSETSHYTVGAKDHYYWAFVDSDKALYHMENNMYQAFQYNDETGEFMKAGAEMDLSTMPEYKEAIEAVQNGYGVYLYAANSYVEGDGLSKKGTLNFIGRSATKYEYKYVVAQGSASYELIVDNDTGITLKWAVSGQSNVTGEKGSASIEATSFKTGSAVQVPAHEPLQK